MTFIVFDIIEAATSSAVITKVDIRPVFTKTFILMLGGLLNRTKSFYVGVVS